jgi:H+/Cl- antiporter ClcA
MANQKGERREFYYGLIIGVFGGILGNLFVSYLIKSFDFFNMPSWIYPISTVIVFVFILILAYVMVKQAR